MLSATATAALMFNIIILLVFLVRCFIAAYEDNNTELALKQILLVLYALFNTWVIGWLRALVI